MDGVLVLLVMLSLVVVIGAMAGLIAITKVSTLQHDVAALKKQLHEIINKTANHPAQIVKNQLTEQQIVGSKETENQPESPRYKQGDAIDTIYSTHPAATDSLIKERPPSLVVTFINKFKTQFQENWMTWIGGIALAFGGIFLAKYSLDAGLLSPSLRLTLGGLFGISMITFAEYLHRKGIVFEGFNNYIPAALAGGGFISCFALMLLAYSSYGMLSPTTTFVLLATIALAASSMALRLGPLLAVIGIIGAYSVPLWVNTGSGNLAALLTYIGFVTLSAVLVAQKVNRTWLWYLLWAGHIGWYWVAMSVIKSTEFWLVGGFALLSIVGLIAMMRLGIFLRLSEYRPHSLKRLLSLKPDHPLLFAIILPLLIKILFSMASVQWLIVLVCLIVLLLFFALQNSRWDLWQGLALIVAVLLLVSQHNYNVDSNDHLFIFKNMYGLGLLLGIGFCCYGLYFGARYYKRLSFHLVAALSMFALVATLYTLTPEQDLAVAYSLWALLLLLGSGILIKRAQNAHTQWQQFSYWVGANANITLCLTMLLADSGLTLALAIQVLVISYLVKRKNVPMPHWPIKALVAGVLARLTCAPWIYGTDLTFLTMHWSVVVYPLSVGLFWFAAKQWQKTQMKIWLEGAALHCLALFITTETSYQLVGHYPQFGFLSFYEQVLLSCNWLALGCVYLYRAQTAGQLGKLYKVAGLILSALAGLLLVSTLLDNNPLLTSLNVGDTPLFNWVLLMWLIPSVLALWLAKLVKPIYAQLSKIVQGVAGGLAVLAINGLIRQYWQGTNIYLDNVTSDAELYSYSIIWLALGALVVILGNLKQQLLLQKVGLGILGAVIVKVFLIDMASLTGLLKAISFIGLGLSLVGLSWLFQKLRSKASV